MTMQSDFTYVGQNWAQMHKLITDSILYPPYWNLLEWGRDNSIIPNNKKWCRNIMNEKLFSFIDISVQISNF